VWGTVVLMAAVTAVDPKRIGVVAVILSRPKTMRLLLAYFIGGFGVSLIGGAVSLFVLEGAGIGAKNSVPPGIEIAVGALALLAAVLIGSGLAERLRDRVQSRNPKAAELNKPPVTDGRSGIEQAPGFAKLPVRTQNALRSESPWVAWVRGVAGGMPTAYYLAAIAAILSSATSAGTAVGALVLFNVVAFASAEIPMISFLIAPEATRTSLDHLYDWMHTHRRLSVAVLAGVVGIYLLAVGISKL